MQGDGRSVLRPYGWDGTYEEWLMVKRVRVGLIGCGTVATERVERAYPALHELGEVVATCDAVPERAETLAAHARWSGADCRVYTALDDLLADPRVQAVDICTPHPYHAEPAIAAAGAGKHVLVEKPMATTLDDGRRMLAAAERAGVVLCVNEQLRVQEPVVRARDMIAAGEIGTPAVVRAHRIGYLEERWMVRGWRQDAAQAGGGMLLDQGPHYFAMLRVLADRWPARSHTCRRWPGRCARIGVPRIRRWWCCASSPGCWVRRCIAGRRGRLIAGRSAPPTAPVAASTSSRRRAA